MTALRVSRATVLSTPVTVTGWAVFQLVVVKVRVAGLTVAASISPEATAISTPAPGCLLSTTV